MDIGYLMTRAATSRVNDDSMLSEREKMSWRFVLVMPVYHLSMYFYLSAYICPLKIGCSTCNSWCDVTGKEEPHHTVKFMAFFCHLGLGSPFVRVRWGRLW